MKARLCDTQSCETLSPVTNCCVSQNTILGHLISILGHFDLVFLPCIVTGSRISTSDSRSCDKYYVCWSAGIADCQAVTAGNADWPTIASALQALSKAYAASQASIQYRGQEADPSTGHVCHRVLAFHSVTISGGKPRHRFKCVTS